MGPEDLIRTCLNEMRDSEGIGVVRAMAGAYSPPLLGTEGVVAVLGAMRSASMARSRGARTGRCGCCAARMF